MYTPIIVCMYRYTGSSTAVIMCVYRYVYILRIRTLEREWRCDLYVYSF